MDNDVRFKGRVNCTIYENNDIDVRIPQENDDLKLEKIKETKAGSLSRTQGKTPILQLRVKTRADAPEPAADLREACAHLLREIEPKGRNLTKISTDSKGCWLSHAPDLKTYLSAFL